MKNKATAFQRFAPAILRVYHRDQNAFWEAIMAPFLTNSFSPMTRLRHFRIDVELLSVFKGLEALAKETLREFSSPLGFDITEWKSNRPQYFKDAYPVCAFLAVWMDEEGMDDLVVNFADVLRAGVFAVAGYGILDANVDSDDPSPVEILTAQALIAEYETLALHIFGVSEVNLGIMQQLRGLFLKAEIKEKLVRGKTSPYRLERPEDLGAKGANTLAPFMLSLERLGKASMIESYWEVFMLFGATIQMIDDWEDLENDLSVGHFSYVTLGFENALERNDPRAVAKLLRADEHHVRQTLDCAKDMINRSRSILTRLNDSLLVKFVDVTEARLESFYRKKLHMK